MQDIDMNTQMELNIDIGRLNKKVKLYEMEAKERKKKKMPKRLKDQIKDRVAAMEKQFESKAWFKLDYRL